FTVADCDRRGAVLVARHGRLDEVALLGGVLGVDGVAFDLAELLNHRLLGRLGGDAAEDAGVDVLIAFLGGDRPVGAINGHSDVLTGSLLAVIFLGRQPHGLFDDAKDRFARDVLVALHQIDEAKQGFSVHAELPPTSGQETKKVGQAHWNAPAWAGNVSNKGGV